MEDVLAVDVVVHVAGVEVDEDGVGQRAGAAEGGDEGDGVVEDEFAALVGGPGADGVEVVEGVGGAELGVGREGGVGGELGVGDEEEGVGVDGAVAAAVVAGGDVVAGVGEFEAGGERADGGGEADVGAGEEGVVHVEAVDGADEGVVEGLALLGGEEPVVQDAEAEREAGRAGGVAVGSEGGRAVFVVKRGGGVGVGGDGFVGDGLAERNGVGMGGGGAFGWGGGGGDGGALPRSPRDGRPFSESAGKSRFFRLMFVYGAETRRRHGRVRDPGSAGGARQHKRSEMEVRNGKLRRQKRIQQQV